MTNLSFTGGASGCRIAEHGRFRPLEHYYTALGFFAVAVVISAWIHESQFGLSLQAVREDEEAAADIGVTPLKAQLMVHLLAATLTGMARGAYARYAASLRQQAVFGLHTRVRVLVRPLVGG